MIYIIGIIVYDIIYICIWNIIGIYHWCIYIITLINGTLLGRLHGIFSWDMNLFPTKSGGLIWDYHWIVPQKPRSLWGFTHIWDHRMGM